MYPFRSDRPVEMPMAHPAKQNRQGHVSNRMSEVIVFQTPLIGSISPVLVLCQQNVEQHPEMVL